MRGGQQRGPINGLDPLIYTGGLPNLVVMTRRPTVKDFQGFFLGHWWIIPKTNDDSPPSEEIWILVGKQNHIATWKRLHAGGTPTHDFLINKIYITTVGAGTYTPTHGMSQVEIECIGAGGGGTVVAGGGAGGYCIKLYTATQIGSSQPYIVGSGGAGEVISVDGHAGEATTFGTGSVLITANGGAGASSSGFDAAGGTGSDGDLNIDGGTGSGIYGSGAAETAQRAVWGSGTVYAPLRFTPSDPSNTGSNGTSGIFPGGGGTSSWNGSIGGNGANGLIIITEYLF